MAVGLAKFYMLKTDWQNFITFQKGWVANYNNQTTPKIEKVLF